MGTSGQDSASWQTGHLSFESVVSLLEQMKITANHQLAVTQQQQATARRRLKFGIDVSLVGFKYVHDKSSLEPDGAVMRIAAALSLQHIDAVIVLDGEDRHCSKRATCERKAKAEKDSIKLLVARTLLQSLLNEGGIRGNQALLSRISRQKK